MNLALVERICSVEFEDLQPDWSENWMPSGPYPEKSYLAGGTDQALEIQLKYKEVMFIDSHQERDHIENFNKQVILQH